MLNPQAFKIAANNIFASIPFQFAYFVWQMEYNRELQFVSCGSEFTTRWDGTNHLHALTFSHQSLSSISVSLSRLPLFLDRCYLKIVLVRPPISKMRTNKVNRHTEYPVCWVNTSNIYRFFMLRLLRPCDLPSFHRLSILLDAFHVIQYMVVLLNPRRTSRLVDPAHNMVLAVCISALFPLHHAILLADCW